MNEEGRNTPSASMRNARLPAITAHECPDTSEKESDNNEGSYNEVLKQVVRSGWPK